MSAHQRPLGNLSPFTFNLWDLSKLSALQRPGWRASRLLNYRGQNRFQASTSDRTTTRNATPLRLGSATPLGNLSPLTHSTRLMLAQGRPFTFHFLISHPSPLTNNPSPVVPSVDRLSQELTRRVSFTSFSMYEMEIFTCLRRGAYGLCGA